MSRFTAILLAMAVLTPGAARAAVPSTAGNNLTAYNPNGGLAANNSWNSMTNGRYDTTGTTAKADFGNCNALIMRCASPKCASGGCTDINVAYPIVSGCVQANASCKQHGDELTQYIAAQLVAQSTARANEQAANAAAAASAAASEAAQQQMQQMQMQMQQMQMEMQQQNEATVAQLQSALDEQKQMTATALAEAATAREQATTAQAAATPTVEGLTTTQTAAAQRGVDADLIYRETVTGEIMTAVENAEMQLKQLKVVMDETFEYAGCDSTGSNCTGPHRVKRFKQYANEFFDPYEGVLLEMLEALESAQGLGVDINDIYMFLDNSCNRWGEFLCQYTDNYYNKSQTRKTMDANGNTRDTYYLITKVYDTENCVNGISVAGKSGKFNGQELDNTGGAGNYVRGGAECTVGMAVPPGDDPLCTMTRPIPDAETVRREYLMNETGSGDSMVRVGCMSTALSNAKIFRGITKKRQAQVDIDTLKNILAQDAPSSFGSSGIFKDAETPDKAATKYCALHMNEIPKLQAAISKRTLTPKVCVPNNYTPSQNDSSSKDDGCSTEANDLINPTLALCTVHAYNIGQTSNPTDSGTIQDMNTAIALKSTIITQQMYQQYQNISTVMRRLKTQLEKAILTSKLKLAAGIDGSNSNTSTSGNGGSSSEPKERGVYMEDARNCDKEVSNGYSSISQCLLSNIALIEDAAYAGKLSDAKKQLDADYQIARRYSLLSNAHQKTNGIPRCGTVSTTKKSITDCAADLKGSLVVHQTEVSNANTGGFKIVPAN